MRIKFIVKPIFKKQNLKEYQEEFLKFKEELQKREGKVEEVFTIAQGENNAQILAQKAIEEGFDRIVLVGGDGLLNEGVNGIIEGTQGRIPSDFALGIIPTGSGNNFAKALKIPKDIKEAFQVIKKDKTTLVDIGKVNERFFVNVVSFGFDAKVNKLANEIKEKYHFLPREGSYLLAALKEIIVKIPLYKIQIEGDEINLKQKVILLAVNNGPSYGAIFKIAPAAAVNDGKFDVCLIESVGRIRALFDIYRVIQGTHIHLPEVKMSKASFLIISSPEPLPYEIDGEVLEPQKKYKISVFPKALKILTS